MKCFKYRLHNKQFGIGVIDFGGFISILLLGFSDNTFSGLRVRKDKLGELVAALCCVYSGQKNKVTIANGSPDYQNSDIIVKRSGYCICIGKRYSWYPNSCRSRLCFIDKIAVHLAQILEAGNSNGVLDVEEFINPVYENGEWRLIFVLNFGNRVVITTLDAYDLVQGIIIPKYKIHTVSNKLLKLYSTMSRTALANYEMSYSYGRGKLVLPGTDSVLFVGETLRNIYDSQ